MSGGMVKQGGFACNSDAPDAILNLRPSTINPEPAMFSNDTTDAKDTNALFSEFARRQNPYFVRDNSPHQVAIKTFWLGLKNTVEPLAFDDVGMSVFSQNNEDGILLYLFSRIGFKTRRSIEIGCNIDNTTIGLPEGNSINLIVNFGFHGLLST